MGKSNANRWHEMFRSPLSFNCIFMEILLYSNKDRYDSNEEICIGQKFVFFVCILYMNISEDMCICYVYIYICTHVLLVNITYR